MSIKQTNVDINVERQLPDIDTTIYELENAGTVGGIPVSGGGGAGTVSSVGASGGVETDTGTPITSSGTIRGAQLVNAQTGVTYTYLTGDRGKLVTHSNAAAIAGTLPQAGTSFPNGWYIDVQNRGAGTLTITPTTSTIDGAASLALRTGEGVRIFSDGTNYYTQRGITGTDATAIHSNVAGEINSITEKTTLALADLVVIEDSAASNAKKKAKIQNVRPQLSYMWQSESPAVTGVHNRFYVDRAGTITEVRPNVVKGDGTSTMNLDVLKNGTSIYPSATKPNVAAAGFTNGSFAPDTTSFSDGDYFTINVTATGGTTGPIRLIIKFKEA